MLKGKFVFGFLFLLSFLFFTQCSQKQKEYFFKAKEIKCHPSPDQAKIIMQVEPDTSFNRLFFGKKRFVQLYFKQDSTEFRFKEGHLFEVIIHKPSLDYDPNSITKFGLKYQVPAEEDTNAFFRWKNQYEGFDVINFYKVGSKKSKRKINYKIFFRLSQ
jgi:hypothetical protein